MEQMAELCMIRFDEHGLIPAIAQDARTGQVLMLAYMNEATLRETLTTGLATYWSRSRQTRWQKGETSGHVQRVRAIRYDCDGDTLLLTVEQEGVACHTGAYSCFHHLLTDGDAAQEPGQQGAPTPDVLTDVYYTILRRKEHPQEGSYTNYLLGKGVEKIAKKIGEEAAETIIAAIKGDGDELRYEIADLFFHTLVLLADRGIAPEAVWAELRERAASQRKRAY